MANRNFSMRDYWNQRAKGHCPMLSFRDYTGGNFQSWQKEAMEKLLELMGPYPEKVPLNAEVECSVEVDGLIYERVVFDTEAAMSVPCWVLRPKDMKPDKTNAAILCPHGHGPFGKDPIAGVRSSPEHDADIASQNYNYGEQLARAGFLTLCPDLRVFGERRDGENPFPGRDPCNVNFIKGSLLGINLLTLNVWDMKCCVDYLETRPEVDPSRIGMVGLSGGGTTTTFTAAVEPRIKAANVCGYINPFAGFAIDRANFCGWQMLPGLYSWLDTHDVAGLIAPRPLLVDMAVFDECFLIQDLTKGYKEVEHIYAAADACDVLSCDIHPHGHAFGGNKAFAFFHKYL